MTPEAAKPKVAPAAVVERFYAAFCASADPTQSDALGVTWGQPQGTYEAAAQEAHEAVASGIVPAAYVCKRLERVPTAGLRETISDIFAGTPRQ